jgi:TolB-like protein
MAVLVYLANRPGSTVSRAALEADVWTGMVVSYDSVTGAIQKLRRVFEDDPGRPHYIESISKKGYRLIAEVSRSGGRTLPPPGAQPPPAAPQARDHRMRRWLADTGIVLAFCVLLVSAYWYHASPWPAPTLVDQAGAKSIAVLPFENLSDNPAQDYFAAGMSDDLIASLARFDDLKVIARDSTAVYRSSPVPAGELARRLNVRYLVRGSVQRDGGQVRINVHLRDARTDEALWGDSFGDQADRLFQMQDRIVARIVTALTGRMNVTDRQELGRPRTRNMRAYDYFLYGREAFFRYSGAEDNGEARAAFQRAVALDPSFALAYAMLAWTHAFDAMNGWSSSRTQSLQQAIGLADRAESAPSLQLQLPPRPGLLHPATLRRGHRDARQGARVQPGGRARARLACRRPGRGRPHRRCPLGGRPGTHWQSGLLPREDRAGLPFPPARRPRTPGRRPAPGGLLRLSSE